MYGVTLHISKKLPTYPWNMPQAINYLFMKDILSYFYVGVPGVHPIYIVGIYWGFLLLKASNRGVKQLGYHPKGTTIFPNGKCMGYIYHTWILWVDGSEIQLTT